MGQRANFYEFVGQLEKVWNKLAKNYIEKERLKIPPDSFRISARIDYKNERGVTARVQAGPVNQIHITYPQRNYRRSIEKTLDYLANPNVHRDEDLEDRRFIGSVVHELYTNAVWKRKDKSGKNRHWKKTSKDLLIKRKKDKSEFASEVVVVNTVKVRHRMTGISITITDKEGREVWDMLEEAYHTCAMKVHEYLEEQAKKEPDVIVIMYPLVPITNILKTTFPLEVLHAYQFTKPLGFYDHLDGNPFKGLN